MCERFPDGLSRQETLASIGTQKAWTTCCIHELLESCLAPAKGSARAAISTLWVDPGETRSLKRAMQCAGVRFSTGGNKNGY